MSRFKVLAKASITSTGTPLCSSALVLASFPPHTASSIFARLAHVPTPSGQSVVLKHRVFKLASIKFIMRMTLKFLKNVR